MKLSKKLRRLYKAYIQGLEELRQCLEKILNEVLPGLDWKVEIGWAENPSCVVVSLERYPGPPNAKFFSFANILPQELQAFVDDPTGLYLTREEIAALLRNRERIIKFLEYGETGMQILHVQEIKDDSLLFTAQSGYFLDFGEVANEAVKLWPDYELVDLRSIRDHVHDCYYFLGLCRKSGG